METVDFALKPEPTRLYMFPLQVLPGTGYWDPDDPTISNYPPSPSMAYSNATYSEYDMRRSYEFSTWFQALQRFYPVRDAVLSIDGGGRKVKNKDLFYIEAKDRPNLRYVVRL